MGCVVTPGGGALQGVKARIKKAIRIFVELYPLWENKNILMKTKIRHVELVLLYGCETWKVTSQRLKVNFALQQATKAHIESRRIIHSFFNPGVRWGGWSTPRPEGFTPWKDPAPII